MKTKTKLKQKKRKTTKSEKIRNENENCGAELCAAWTNCTATEFWQAHLDGHPLLTKVTLDLSSAPASQSYT